MARLKGKVAIVTGGNSGVGAATALLFAKEGAKVVISARREAQLIDVANKIKEAGGEVLTVVADISNTDSVKNLIAKTVEVFGKIDVLVNNAGVLEEGLKPIESVLDDDIDYIIDTNTKGTIYCIREAANEMMKTGNGSIINVASIAGVHGCGGAAYVSSKAAIIGVTKHTALRFAGTNIRCNVVCPGTIVTPMLAQMNPEKLNRNMMTQMSKHSDLTVNPCMPDDVANIILFLSSDESRAITGQTLISDFGCTL
ncbi:MAG: SDR family oxidoreductase [Clostridium sp.]|uniref:SDR family NAD(P)-dependent oxidoreductase n=1 Tax=Clostridium sp. TaxID=1506 RepID=UPI0025BC1719|nr:SDR family NAD(P)-dependent oxidoreductase [Clostridium sp.]MCF0148804.1 SDR family oxidoreductase [Clostridium sp.]